MRFIPFILFIFPFVGLSQNFDFEKTWKTDKDLKGASIGFCVMDVKTSEVIQESNSKQQLIPASTLKIVTTTAALHLLGNNFRYSTKLMYSGTLNASGSLNGDLIIVGSGDPTLQSEKFGAGSVTDFWAQKLKEKGIKEVKGAIIGDASCFERSIADDWIWADIGNYFGAVPCGLSYRDNKFKIVFNTGTNGSRTSIQKTEPNYLEIKYVLKNEVTSKGSEDEAYVYGDPFGFEKIIKGTLPTNKLNYEVEAALPDPALLCAEHLYNSLNKIGILCQKNKITSRYEKADSITLNLLFTHYSPTLDKIIYHTNLSSNNLYCESLLKTLGKGSSAKGIEVIKKHFTERGLDIDQLYMVDGSGLSRANTITPLFEAQLLSKIYKDSTCFRIIHNSLPIAGKNGSMSNIGKGTFIENNLHAKTGYVKRCRAYCGYVKTKAGKDLAFSVVFNNYNCTAREAKLKLEKFLVGLSDL
jgi:D-alanyl-D-alanine carboxypeptidase/D-alanyl-D-alanine-endopeptidase (penicillin-binding protein 4)